MIVLEFLILNSHKFCAYNFKFVYNDYEEDKLSQSETDSGFDFD